MSHLDCTVDSCACWCWDGAVKQAAAAASAVKAEALLKPHLDCTVDSRACWCWDGAVKAAHYACCERLIQAIRVAHSIHSLPNLQIARHGDVGDTLVTS
jgi:hypothetical protein